MRYRIVPSSDAEADVTSVSWWYQRIDPNLTSRFIGEVRATVRRIAQFPYRFQLVNGAARQARLARGGVGWDRWPLRQACRPG